MIARLIVLLVTRAWGLIIAGIIIAGVGGVLFPSNSGATLTPKYAKGCIEEHVYAQDGSDHTLQLGQGDSQGNCVDDPSQSGIGYHFLTSDLNPSFPLTLQGTGIFYAEVWYKPDLTSGTCGSTDNQRSCQIATVVALRTYSADSSGNNVMAGTLYESSGFSIGSGDLTQQSYNPNSATYKNGNSLLPIGLLAAGLLILAGGVVWLMLGRGARKSKMAPQMMTPQGAYPSQPAYGQSAYPQQSGYGQPPYPPQQPAGGAYQPGYGQPTYPSQPGYGQTAYPQSPQYPQQPGSGQWPNQGQ